MLDEQNVAVAAHDLKLCTGNVIGNDLAQLERDKMVVIGAKHQRRRLDVFQPRGEFRLLFLTGQAATPSQHGLHEGEIKLGGILTDIGLVVFICA